MSLAAILEKACQPLTNNWIHAANAVYPLAAAGFLHTKTDPFANPVGERSRELSLLLLKAAADLPCDEAAFHAALEEFVRVRAMQDSSASITLQVMFAYKNIIRDYLKDRKIPADEYSTEELEALDGRLDLFALLTFDIYTRQRETFFEVRLNDTKRRYNQILRLAQRHGLAETVTGDADQPS